MARTVWIEICTVNMPNCHQAIKNPQMFLPILDNYQWIIQQNQLSYSLMFYCHIYLYLYHRLCTATKLAWAFSSSTARFYLQEKTTVSTNHLMKTYWYPQLFWLLAFISILQSHYFNGTVTYSLAHTLESICNRMFPLRSSANWKWGRRHSMIICV